MSEKRTQNKGTKKQQEIQNYRRKEKSFNWVWLGVSVLLVIGVIATGVMLNVADIRQTPKMVMKEYFELLSKGKYEEMYAFVSDTSGIEKKAFLEKNKNIYEGIQMSGLQVKFDKEKKKKNCHLTSVHKYLHLEQTVRFLLKFSWQIQDMGRENYLSIQFILRPFTLHLSMREI